MVVLLVIKLRYHKKRWLSGFGPSFGDVAKHTEVGKDGTCCAASLKMVKRAEIASTQSTLAPSGEEQDKNSGRQGLDHF